MILESLVLYDAIQDARFSVSVDDGEIVLESSLASERSNPVLKDIGSNDFFTLTVADGGLQISAPAPESYDTIIYFRDASDSDRYWRLFVDGGGIAIAETSLPHIGAHDSRVSRVVSLSSGVDRVNTIDSNVNKRIDLGSEILMVLGYDSAIYKTVEV